jgi:hypothetical protein
MFKKIKKRGKKTNEKRFEGSFLTFPSFFSQKEN